MFLQKFNFKGTQRNKASLTHLNFMFFYCIMSIETKHTELKQEEAKSEEAKSEEVKSEEVKLEAVKPEVMDRGCMKCTKTTATICKTCICCWRFFLNSCEVVMDCNIRCCTCAKQCLERIDCDETP